MVARYPSCPACRKLSAELGEACWKVLQDWHDAVAAPDSSSHSLHGALRGFGGIVPANRVSLVTPMGEDRLRVVASSDLRWTGDILISLERYPELSTVLKTGRPFLAEDVKTSPVLRPVLPSLEGLGIVSLMAIPLELSSVPMIFRLLSTGPSYGKRDVTMVCAAAHLLEHVASAQPTSASRATAWKELVTRMADCVVEVLADGRVASIEGRTVELFGRASTELEGTQAADLFWSPRTESSGRHLFRLLEPFRGGGTWAQTTTLRTAGGRTTNVSLAELPGFIPRMLLAVRVVDERGLSLDDLPLPAFRIRGQTVVAANSHAMELSSSPTADELLKLLTGTGRTLSLKGRTGSVEYQIFRHTLEEPGEALVLLAGAGPWADALQRIEALRGSLARTMRELEEAQQRMVRLETLKSHFMASSAHELKTPLTVLQSYVEILTTDLADGLSDEQRSFLEIVYRNVLRLRRLVLDLTDLAALEGGQISVEIGRVELGNIVDRVVQDMQPRAREGGLRLETELAPHLPDLRADGSRVEQVLHNLVDNAIKYTPAGGSVTITAAGHGDSVVVEVRDTGVGIQPDEKSAIFEPFYRVTGHRPGIAAEGSGLGLTISRRILGALGGRLTVTSVPGKGSTFRMQLPSWPEGDTRDD